MDTPWSQLQTPLHCVRCGCYLGLNDPGVLASAWRGECPWPSPRTQWWARGFLRFFAESGWRNWFGAFEAVGVRRLPGAQSVRC